MNIEQLVAAVGAANFSTQPLDLAVVDMRRGEAENRITFFTAEGFTARGLSRYGLVLWADRNLVESALQVGRDPDVSLFVDHFKSEVFANAKQWDSAGELDWASLCVGWALAKGLSIELSKEIAEEFSRRKGSDLMCCGEKNHG